MADKVAEILAKHPEAWRKFKLTGDFELGGPMFVDLYEHFVSNGEMPYGIAKARDGDPDVWIANYLEEHCLGF